MRSKSAGLFVFSICIILFSPYGRVTESVAGDVPGEVGSQFVGSWSLVSFTDIDEQGKSIHRMGEDAFGRIVYGANGRMMVILMRSGRENPDDAGFFSYTGSYDVDEVAGTVTHHIDACSAPGWIGTDRVRNFEMLNGKRIALRPVEGTSELIWRREQ